MAFKDQHFASFVTDVGGATSHTAILHAAWESRRCSGCTTRGS